MDSSKMNEAVEFVMDFYQLSKEDAIKYYIDEINAYLDIENRNDNY